MFKMKDLQQILDNDFNLLLEGPHGVGKTEVVKKLFEDNNLKWRYFSAPTLDPWTDIVGVPRASAPDENNNQYLELILPKDFAEDNVEALFFDELNRAPDKVINAVMELLQFKSINGKRFNNLRVVWASINPYDEDETYAVCQLDPAVRDRFQVYLNIRPDYIDSKYFSKKYGKISDVFVKWWKSNETYRHVSPRRLDYAISAYNKNIDLNYVLPVKSNVNDLKKQLIAFNKPEQTKSKVDFVEKPKGDYSIEEAAAAYENRAKININLQSSLEMINIINKDSELHPLLNYVHQEALIESAKQSKTREHAYGRSIAYNYIMNYDEAINTNENFSKDDKDFLTFICRGPFDNERPANIHDSKFYKKYLKSIQL